jgi:hypothetical protein
MSNYSEIRRRRERGSVMIDSLISAALTSIIGAGTAHIAARVATAQHELRVEGVAIAELREQLNRSGEGLCDEPPTRSLALPGGGSAEFTIGCGDAPAVTIEPGITAGGTTPASRSVTGVRPVTATVPLAGLGVNAETGASIVVGTQQ